MDDMIAKQQMRNLIERLGLDAGSWVFSEEECGIFAGLINGSDEVISIAAVWPEFDYMEVGDE